MTGREAVVQDVIERMLHTGERLRGIVVLVVHMQVVVAHGITALLRQQVVIDKGLGALRGELHHHTGRCVSVHVRVLAGHVVVLDVDDLQEHITGLGLPGNATLVTVGDVFLCHILAGTLHQLHLHGILDVLDGHLRLPVHVDMVSDHLDEALVLTLVGM